MQLLPRFSLRMLFVAAIGASLLGLIMRQAVLGAEWAIAIAVALASLVLIFAFHVLLFGLVRLFGLLGGVHPDPPAQPIRLNKVRSIDL